MTTIKETKMKTQLSKLEDVDIRSIWDNETTEFTPWLAQPENIDNISEQIGIDLTVEEKEKPVGPYRADIFCKDEDLNISAKYLKPGYAIGGSCLPKDLNALLKIAESKDLNLTMLDSINKSNTYLIEATVKKFLKT